MKKNVAAALAGALSLSLAAGVVAADKPLSSKAGVQKSAQGSCGVLKPVKVHAVQALFLKQAKANVAKANAVQPWKKLTLKKAKHLKPKLPK